MRKILMDQERVNENLPKQSLAGCNLPKQSIAGNHLPKRSRLTAASLWLLLLFFLVQLGTTTGLAAEPSERALLTLEGTYEFSVSITNADDANTALQHSYQYTDPLPADLVQHTFTVDVKGVDGEYLLFHKGEAIDNSGLGRDKKTFFFSFFHKVTSSAMQNIGYEIKASVAYDEDYESFDILSPGKASLIVFTQKDGAPGYGYIGNGTLEMKKLGDKPAEEEPEETDAAEHKSQLPRALTFVRGRVAIKRAGSDEWMLARKGMQLNAGDAIKTAEGAYADIGMSTTEFGITGSEIRMAPLSTITIPDDTLVVEKKSRVRVTIEEGIKNVYSLFKKEEFVVETPSAVMGIRGTDFIIEVDDEGNTRVLLNDGTVDVVSRFDDRERTLFAGEKVEAKLGAKIGNKEGMTEADLAAFDEYDFKNLPPETDADADASTDTVEPAGDSDADTANTTADKKSMTPTILIAVLAVFLILVVVLVIKRKK